ncbi:DMT family transporter [Moritella viscosa]
MMNITYKTNTFNLNEIAPILFLLMWSSGAVMVRVGLLYSSVWTFLAIRALISLSYIGLIYLVMIKINKTPLKVIATKDKIQIWIVGLLLQVLYLSFYFISIDTGISPGLVTLILGLQPLLIPIFCKHKLDSTKVALLMLGFVGLSIAILGTKDVEMLALSGILFAGLALLSITLGTIRQGKLEVNLVQAMFYQNLLSASIFVVIGYINGWHFSALWMSVVVSVGALLLLMYMIQRESSDSVGVLFYAIPILTFLFDYFLFDEKLTLVTFIGIILVATSVVLYRKKAVLQSTSNT